MDNFGSVSARFNQVIGALMNHERALYSEDAEGSFDMRMRLHDLITRLAVLRDIGRKIEEGTIAPELVSAQSELHELLDRVQGLPAHDLAQELLNRSIAIDHLYEGFYEAATNAGGLGDPTDHTRRD